jgi:putative Mn2+ efflux pump MntP
LSLLSLLALAVALALDAFAVAVAVGAALKAVSGRQTFRLAWHFGLFQALMPILGWAAGRTVSGLLQAADHWVAFGILAFVGARMAAGAFREQEARESDPTRGLTLLLLSIATSLDALAVGLSLSLLDVSIWWPATVIGVVAAAFTAAGLQAGRLAGSAARIGRWAELGGGVVLLLIGVKILLDHGAVG